uniref:Eukaryotic translation initiation factor 2-alpha kinase 1 n=1 Tax=Callorhinchus milii TaxID=7868 RepID=V9KJK6_CALMI
MAGRAGWLGGGPSAGIRQKVRNPRVKLAISFPQEPEATLDESDLSEELSLVKCNQRVPGLMDFTDVIPNQLLLVSLLEHLCFVYERCPERSICLFKLLCQKLAGMHLISPFTFSDEFSAVRLQHKEAFNNLLMAAQDGLYTQDNISRDASTACVSRMKENLFQGQPSRYMSEFEEVSRLGKGGYGKVYKVRNKLDGQFYAVKKILMMKVTRYDCMKVLREVKVLAGLQHPNIVGYHTAWMEHVQLPPALTGNQVALRALVGPSGQVYQIDSNVQKTWSGGSSIVFGDSGSVAGEVEADGMDGNIPNKVIQKNWVAAANKPLSESLAPRVSGNSFKMNSSVFCSESKLVRKVTRDICLSARSRLEQSSCLPVPSVEVMEEEEATGDTREGLAEHSFSMNSSSSEDDLCWTESKINFHLMLYIQMQLCEESLQDWIMERNARQRERMSLTCPFHLVIPDFTMNIFRQLLEGVDNIHSKGIMHRDLKPRNIFLHGSNCHVRIGDFGLACKDDIESLDPWAPTISTADLEHTSGVGTSLYASPEQLKGSHYDFKSDMYSLGIILLELFQPFGTEMERNKTLAGLREGHIPDTFRHQWPVQTKYIKLLTSSTAAHRPSAAQVLGSNLFHITDGVEHNFPQLEELQQKVVEQEEEIRILREKLVNQEAEIRSLREKVLNQEEVTFVTGRGQS